MTACEFNLGDTVYLKIDGQTPGMVTGILFRAIGVQYVIRWADDMQERHHYAIELTNEKSFEAPS